MENITKILIKKFWKRCVTLPWITHMRYGPPLMVLTFTDDPPLWGPSPPLPRKNVPSLIKPFVLWCSSNQNSFPLDLLQSNTVILPPIFRMIDFSKLPIFRTLPFKNLHSISRTLKVQESTETGFSHIHTWMELTNSGEGVFMRFFFNYKASDKSQSLKS